MPAQDSDFNQQQSDQSTLAMAGVPEQFEHASDRAEFKRVQHRAGLELYRAHIVSHAFEPHTHNAFGLGAIASGVERFRYAGSDHLAPQDSIVMMNPDELHTGRAETEAGWGYRMIYIEQDMLEEITGERAWYFRDAVVHDVMRARRLSALLEQLWRAADKLSFDSALFDILSEFKLHASTRQTTVSLAKQRFDVVIDYMRAHLSQRLSLEQLAGVIGLSPFHFLRSFKSQFHATPQQMLMALRLFEAKRLLAIGLPPAQVAAATGLTDQSHLNKAFVRRYGVTPARYQQQMRA